MCHNHDVRYLDSSLTLAQTNFILRIMRRSTTYLR